MSAEVSRLFFIYAVWRRHAERYFRTWHVNCLPPITEPIVYFVAFGYGLGPLVGEVTYMGKAVSYLNFIAPGSVAVAILFQSYFEGAYGTFIRTRYQRTPQSLLTTPLTYPDIFWGEYFWAATKGLVASFAAAAAASVLGSYSMWHYFAVFPVVLCGCCLFAAIGMLAASVVETIDHINFPTFALIVPMFVFCGTYFPRNTLPEHLKLFSDLLPLSSIIDLLRAALAAPPSYMTSIAVLMFWLIAVTALAFRMLRRRLFK